MDNIVFVEHNFKIKTGNKTHGKRTSHFRMEHQLGFHGTFVKSPWFNKIQPKKKYYFRLNI